MITNIVGAKLIRCPLGYVGLISELQFHDLPLSNLSSVNERSSDMTWSNVISPGMTSFLKCYDLIRHELSDLTL